MTVTTANPEVSFKLEQEHLEYVRQVLQVSAGEPQQAILEKVDRAPSETLRRLTKYLSQIYAPTVPKSVWEASSRPVSDEVPLTYSYDNRQDYVGDCSLTYSYKDHEFYVRECYPMYYDYMLHILGFKKVEGLPNTKLMDFISVTGTPGNGKSLFYMYTFQKLREEYPDITIVAASFTDNRYRGACRVFRGKTCEESNSAFASFTDDRYMETCRVFRGKTYADTNSALYDALLQYSRENVKKAIIQGVVPPKIIFLYDGPPDMDPTDYTMICFACPNYEWLDSMVGAANHCTLYMPVWTLEEFYDANQRLGLPDTEDDIKERFTRYGGVARYCLSYDDYAEEEIAKGLARITSMRSINEYLSEKQLISQSILYFEPKGVFFEDYELFFGSPFIMNAFIKQIEQRIESGARKFLDELEGYSRTASLYGHVFERYAHNALEKGGTFNFRPLNDGVEEKTLIVRAMSCIEFQAEEISTDENPYFKPASKNFESLAAYYFSDSELYIFQMTKSTKHPIKASGLASLLQRIGYANQLDMVHFVFVVPKDDGTFKEQEFKYDLCADSADIFNEPVTAIKKISDKSAEILFKKGIKTVGDLCDAADSGTVEACYSSAVEQFRKSFQNSVLDRSLESIPQYCMELEI